jgi:type I restriction enzyme S subunit
MTIPGWRECTLGELLEIKHGFAFKGKYFGRTGTHILLTPGNFLDDGGFRDKGDEEKWYAGPIPSEYVLEKGDIVVAMTEQAEGLLGSSAIVPASDLYLHNQRIGLVKLRPELAPDPRFIYYLFNTPTVRTQIRASASGAKIRHTAPSRIADVKVAVPTSAAQRHIAAILAAYDDLIGANLRRIRLLEEMAHTAYREWFVHFRFPGHEGLSLVNSALGPLPNGWRAARLNEVADLTMGQAPPGTSYNEVGNGLPFHQGVRDFADRFPSDRLYCTAPGRFAEAGDILFSVRAPVGRMNIAQKRMVIGRGLSALRHKWGDQAFLWEQLQERFQEENMMGNGAIFAAVTKRDLEQLLLLNPSETILTKAELVLRPIHDIIEVLSAQSVNLRATRDLLLPRLMSGRLSLAHAEAAL